MSGDGFVPAKVARRGPQADPAGKCMEVISTAGGHLTWCTNDQAKGTPEHRPRCTQHRDNQPEEKQ